MKNKNEDSRNIVITQAESEIISIFLNSNGLQSEIMSKLSSDDFSIIEHRKIFTYIKAMFDRSELISFKTLCDYVSNLPKDASSILVSIKNINDKYAGDIAYEHLIQIVFNNSLIGKLNNAIIEIDQIKNSSIKTPPEIIQEAQSKLLSINTSLTEEKTISISESVKNILLEINSRKDKHGQLTGITSGFKDLDIVTNGFQNGDFIIIAARPSMGKTAFALNLALNASGKSNVFFFSLEMPEVQITQRLLSSKSLVNLRTIRSGFGVDLIESLGAINAAADDIAKNNLFIDDTPGLTLLEIQSRIRKAKNELNIDICFIDYLQLISGEMSSDNRQNEISKISRGLKKISRELNIPIICLSQLSRSVEKREDKKPMMSDLRDSGAIEQDADIVMFLYREGYYEHNLETNDLTSNNIDQEETELIISKHRNGATGIIKFGFAKSNGLFIEKSFE